MPRRVLFSTLLFLAAFAQGGSFTLTEEHLPERIRQHNGAVRAAEDFLASVKSQRGHWGRSYLPEVTAQVGGETFESGPFKSQQQPFGRIDATVNLYRGGRDQAEEERRQANLESAQADFDRVYFDSLEEARKLFWVVVFQQEMLGFLQTASETNKAMLASAKQRIQGGLATETDRLEFEMNQTQLEQDVARLRLDGRRAERRLHVILAVEESETFEIPTTIPHAHTDELLTARFDPPTHRDVRAISGLRQALELESHQHRLWWRPSLDLFGDYSLYTFRERDYAARRDRDERVAGAKLSMAFFDRGAGRRQARTLALQSQARAKEREQTIKKLRSEFVSFQEDLRTLHDLIHSAEEGAEQGRLYLKRTRSEYSRGVKNSPDVLNAFQNYVELERRYAEIRRDYQLTKTQLLTLLER